MQKKGKGTKMQPWSVKHQESNNFSAIYFESSTGLLMR